MHDPGGKSLFPLKPGVIGAAYITPDFLHRLWLSRRWGSDARFALIVGLNPSVASPEFDDPTIVRDCGFAQRWGCDGLFKLNLSTYRATDPKKLLQLSREQLQHSEARHVVRKIAARCSIVVCAWGVVAPTLSFLVDAMREDLVAAKKEPYCFGLTKGGHPRHTLYLRSDTALVQFKSEKTP